MEWICSALPYRADSSFTGFLPVFLFRCYCKPGFDYHKWIRRSQGTSRCERHATNNCVGCPFSMATYPAEWTLFAALQVTGFLHRLTGFPCVLYGLSLQRAGLREDFPFSFYRLIKITMHWKWVGATSLITSQRNRYENAHCFLIMFLCFC